MSSERAVHELRAQASPSLGTGRAVALGLALCALAFGGALAAGGVSSHVGSPPRGSFSVVELIALTLIGVIAVLGLVALIWSRSWDEDRRDRRRRPLWKRILEVAVLAAVIAGSLAVLMLVVPRHPIGRDVGHGSTLEARPDHAAPPPRGPLDSSWARGAAFAAGAAIGILALFLVYRHPTGPAREDHDDEMLDRAIAAGLEGLESDPDPRRAVIKAYSGMEHALAEDGLPRRPSETPLEYLRRALERLHASQAATTRLTALFEQAKFSSHTIDEPMRRDAVAALGDLRAELAR